MKNFKFNTPAKINLGLNIINKREDGYHNIETIFYPVNLCDTITFTPANSFTFASNVPLLNNISSNLIVKAKEVLEERFNRKFNLEIKLEKRIPISAGMGGGSSDAAATLIALKDLYDLEIELEELKKLALKIGSDVPFFLNPVASFADSRGENLIEIDLKINKPILIVNPGIHVSTRWAYANCKPSLPNFRLNNLTQENVTIPSDLHKFVKNDFEEAVFNNYPLIGEIKRNLLKTGASFALMTGSGSTVFGIFNNIKDAQKAQKSFGAKYFTHIHFEN